MKKNKILILFAHPLYEESRVNQILNQYIPDNEHITFHDLYELYPEFEIDVKTEQKLIMDHDIIIWQHPMYWYSCPSLLKQWLDMVLHFRRKSDLDIHALKGKAVLQVMSIGQLSNTYLDNSQDQHTTLEYLLPFRKIALYSNMMYLPPFLVRIPKMMSIQDVHKKGKDYAYILEAMISNFVSADDFMRFETMNDWINSKKSKTFG